MNEPTPAWIEWSSGGVTWGLADPPLFPERSIADTMPSAHREATIAPRRKTLPQRICLHPGCITILSKLNREDFCGSHMRYHSRVPA